MKTIYQAKYELELFFKSNRIALPIVATALFMGFLYSISPLDVMSGFMMTSTFLFILMMVVSFSIIQSEDPTNEAILFLRRNSSFKYYLGKVFTLLTISFIFTFVCTVYPFIGVLINGEGMFIRKLTFNDFIHSFFIIFAASICGASVGSFFHEKVLADRRFASLLLALIGILSVVKYSVADTISFSKFILWIIPASTMGIKEYASTQYFNIETTLSIVIIYMVFATVLFTIKGFICIKR